MRVILYLKSSLTLKYSFILERRISWRQHSLDHFHEGSGLSSILVVPVIARIPKGVVAALHHWVQHD
jgi:hypothetical protein